jgi:transposase
MRVVRLDDSRLDGVFNLGVDEISSIRRCHQYLTVVADHDSGRVLHVAKGRSQGALQSFFDLLGPTVACRCRPSCPAAAVAEV